MQLSGRAVFAAALAIYMKNVVALVVLEQKNGQKKK
jgi:hypothetical protein